MVHEDEFSASMLLLPPSDTVAFWFGRLSRISPVARRPSLLFVSEASISVSAGAFRSQDSGLVAARQGASGATMSAMVSRSFRWPVNLRPRARDDPGSLSPELPPVACLEVSH